MKGKLIYSWGDADRGRVEIEVTPRAHRAPLPDGASAYQRAADREPTPERALRKMAQKVRRLKAKAAKGEHERLVARAAAQPKESTLGAAGSDEHPALRSLLATASIAFLASMRSHYCENCDEEWPVFDSAWPDTGVCWAGAKADVCQAIQRSGFQQASSGRALCSRCDKSPVYRRMYCKEHLQHLGPRCEALSNLTW